MLVFSAILSSIVLAVIGAILSYGAKPRIRDVLCILGLAGGGVLVGCFLPCLMMQGLLLSVLTAVDEFRLYGKRTYLILASVATVLPYAIVALVQWHSLYSLQQQFPYESVETWLPTKRYAGISGTKAPNEKSVAILESQLDECIDNHRSWMGERKDNLETLHENAVAAFLESPGFGVVRMRRMAVSEAALQIGLEEERTHPQPVPRGSEAMSPGDPGLPIAGTAQPFLVDFHQNSVLDFVYPEGFGYFKDRNHVAGFRPHQFRNVPGPAQSWRVETLELVGLVVHDEPAVYVSDLLPRMDVLRKAPVRPPNAFETLGLVDLAAGETLVVRMHGEKLRLLGAIRATKQCIACHDCERGDLLGAFSYVLRK